jgi:hypothetical protein
VLTGTRKSLAVGHVARTTGACSRGNQTEASNGADCPIEADPLLGAAIREAAEEAARAAYLAGHHGKGKCHVIWRMQKKILAERHGIVWFSPQDMNPSAFFD